VDELTGRVTPAAEAILTVEETEMVATPAAKNDFAFEPGHFDEKKEDEEDDAEIVQATMRNENDFQDADRPPSVLSSTFDVLSPQSTFEDHLLSPPSSRPNSALSSTFDVLSPKSTFDHVMSPASSRPNSALSSTFDVEESETELSDHDDDTIQEETERIVIDTEEWETTTEPEDSFQEEGDPLRDAAWELDDVDTVDDHDNDTDMPLDLDDCQVLIHLSPLAAQLHSFVEAPLDHDMPHMEADVEKEVEQAGSLACIPEEDLPPPPEEEQADPTELVEDSNIAQMETVNTKEPESPLPPTEAVDSEDLAPIFVNVKEENVESEPKNVVVEDSNHVLMDSADSESENAPRENVVDNNDSNSVQMEPVDPEGESAPAIPENVVDDNDSNSAQKEPVDPVAVVANPICEAVVEDGATKKDLSDTTETQLELRESDVVESVSKVDIVAEEKPLMEPDTPEKSTRPATKEGAKIATVVGDIAESKAGNCEIENAEDSAHKDTDKAENCEIEKGEDSEHKDTDANHNVQVAADDDDLPVTETNCAVLPVATGGKEENDSCAEAQKIPDKVDDPPPATAHDTMTSFHQKLGPGAIKGKLSKIPQTMIISTVTTSSLEVDASVQTPRVSVRSVGDIGTSSKCISTEKITGAKIVTLVGGVSLSEGKTQDESFVTGGQSCEFVLAELCDATNTSESRTRAKQIAQQVFGDILQVQVSESSHTDGTPADLDIAGDAESSVMSVKFGLSEWLKYCNLLGFATDDSMVALFEFDQDDAAAIARIVKESERKIKKICDASAGKMDIDVLRHKRHIMIVASDIASFQQGKRIVTNLFQKEDCCQSAVFVTKEPVVTSIEKTENVTPTVALASNIEAKNEDDSPMIIEANDNSTANIAEAPAVKHSGNIEEEDIQAKSQLTYPIGKDACPDSVDFDESKVMREDHEAINEPSPSSPKEEEQACSIDQHVDLDKIDKSFQALRASTPSTVVDQSVDENMTPFSTTETPNKEAETLLDLGPSESIFITAEDSSEDPGKEVDEKLSLLNPINGAAEKVESKDVSQPHVATPATALDVSADASETDSIVDVPGHHLHSNRNLNIHNDDDDVVACRAVPLVLFKEDEADTAQMASSCNNPGVLLSPLVSQYKVFKERYLPAETKDAFKNPSSLAIKRFGSQIQRSKVPATARDSSSIPLNRRQVSLLRSNPEASGVFHVMKKVLTFPTSPQKVDSRDNANHEIIEEEAIQVRMVQRSCGPNGAEMTDIGDSILEEETDFLESFHRAQLCHITEEGHGQEEILEPLASQMSVEMFQKNPHQQNQANFRQKRRRIEVVAPEMTEERLAQLVSSWDQEEKSDSSVASFNSFFSPGELSVSDVSSIESTDYNSETSEESTESKQAGVQDIVAEVNKKYQVAPAAIQRRIHAVAGKKSRKKHAKQAKRGVFEDDHIATTIQIVCDGEDENHTSLQHQPLFIEIEDPIDVAKSESFKQEWMRWDDQLRREEEAILSNKYFAKLIDGANGALEIIEKQKGRIAAATDYPMFEEGAEGDVQEYDDGGDEDSTVFSGEIDAADDILRTDLKTVQKSLKFLVSGPRLKKKQRAMKMSPIVVTKKSPGFNSKNSPARNTKKESRVPVSKRSSGRSKPIRKQVHRVHRIHDEISGPLDEGVEVTWEATSRIK